MELKARFDESANIRWANRLEEAGIHVSYGVVGFKTHCKVIYVLRRDHDGLRRYAHIGTGNYHAGTARLYSDLGIACDPEIGEDLTELFNFPTSGGRSGISPPQVCGRWVSQDNLHAVARGGGHYIVWMSRQYFTFHKRNSLQNRKDKGWKISVSHIRVISGTPVARRNQRIITCTYTVCF